MRGLYAVGSVDAKHIEVAVPEATILSVEGLKRLALVGLNRGDGSLQHGAGFLRGAVFGRGKCGGRGHEGNETRNQSPMEKQCHDSSFL